MLGLRRLHKLTSLADMERKTHAEAGWDPKYSERERRKKAQNQMIDRSSKKPDLPQNGAIQRICLIQNCKIKLYVLSGTIYLIHDIHPSHRTRGVKQVARELNIVLLCIPSGATDRLQPLDRCVLGALKSEARRPFRERISGNTELKRSKRDVVDDMLAAWARLSDETLEVAWDVHDAGEK